MTDDMALRPPNGLALCAGAGGLDLAMQIAEPGYRTVCHVEREAAAAASLVARMEDQTLDQAPVWDNLGSFDGRPWRGLVDIVTSGDPCQPNSNAGKRRGEDDDRWLIDQVIRIVEEVRPDTFFRENVAGNADGQLGAIVPALERLGYRTAAGIFSARETGASHERQRLFILAHRQGPGQQAGGHSGGAAKEYTELGHGGANMADTIGGGHHGRPYGAGRQALERTIAERTGAELALRAMGYADGSRHDEGRPGPSGKVRDQSRRSEPDRRGQRMADTGGTGSQGGEQPGQPGQAERRLKTGATTAELRSARLPLYAPGPGDIDAWREILAIDPTLEPAICRTSDGMAYRNDRLRLCGNGVVPLAGAVAYRTLTALLAGDRGAATCNVLTKTARQAVA